MAFEQIMSDAGAPAGVYTNGFLSNDQVASLIDDPRTRGVALTGSERAGESLAARAGKNLKKSTMELGGSDAFILLEDYDLDDAVKMAVLGRIGNAGQTCIGAKRFIIVGPRAKKFLSKFRSALEQLNIGDPFDETTTLGPLSSEAALKVLLKQVDEAVSHGAKVLTGGKRIEGKGAFMQRPSLPMSNLITRPGGRNSSVLWPSSSRPGMRRRQSASRTIRRLDWAVRFSPTTSNTVSNLPAASTPA
jgi:succinate-semialdehyde dehydrogenase/glutarate-semialdehyde dehydrogenase